MISVERKTGIFLKETSVFLLCFENLLHSVIHKETAQEFERSLIINIRKTSSLPGIGNIFYSWRVREIHNGKSSKQNNGSKCKEKFFALTWKEKLNKKIRIEMSYIPFVNKAF